MIKYCPSSLPQICLMLLVLYYFNWTHHVLNLGFAVLFVMSFNDLFGSLVTKSIPFNRSQFTCSQFIYKYNIYSNGRTFDIINCIYNKVFLCEVYFVPGNNSMVAPVVGRLNPVRVLFLCIPIMVSCVWYMRQSYRFRIWPLHVRII